MNLIDKYLGEMTDPRGKVKSGKVTLDANNDLGRALGDTEDWRVSSQEEIEKVYKESKKYWKDGGKYIKVEGKPVKLELHFSNTNPNKQYYASYSWGGWVGSTKEYSKPEQAMKAIEKQLMQKVKEGSYDR
jgi:hypothetical protein